ncbi:Outer membrane protein (porin) [Collimonas sp. OK307]|uniref:porin n=1 Tax=Collimonas sp. OK307 TaxID=1801620 RepID=UPI0008E8CE9C|nr:porin [Collimonas sp. OK307]SFI32154.1 Outer membrane protein (porin) [Collimonas sp. OK307]
MKSITYGALALATLNAVTAQAQSQVTMYGVVDTGLAYTTNVNAAGNAQVKMPSLTGSLPSRIGFKVTEDLGGGLQALFVLENGFSVDSGSINQGGRLFGRQSWVGLKNAYGTLMLGRQVNMTYLATQKADVLGPNLFSISSMDPYLPNARSDNAIGYLGNFSDLVIGGTYSTGRDTSSAGGAAGTGCAGEVAGNAKACRQITALIGYESTRYGINTSYDILYGGPGAANGLTSADNHDQRVTANGYVIIGSTKIGAGVIARRVRAATGTTTSDLYYAGVTQPLSPLLQLDVQAARRNVKDSSDDTTMLVARLSYFLSKRTLLYSAIGSMSNEGNAAIALEAGGTVGAGKRQNGVMAGLRHMF